MIDSATLICVQKQTSGPCPHKGQPRLCFALFPADFNEHMLIGYTKLILSQKRKRIKRAHFSSFTH